MRQRKPWDWQGREERGTMLRGHSAKRKVLLRARGVRSCGVKTGERSALLRYSNRWFYALFS